MSEILSYEKFIENLRRYLLDALNLQEERIYFEAKDEEEWLRMETVYLWNVV